jgi:hypothetical protein
MRRDAHRTDQTRLQAVIRRYAQLRLETARGVLGAADLKRALAQSDQMHSEMTQLVAQALKNGTPISVSLTNTLNAVSSNQASRLSAFRDRLPASIVVLLFAAAISSVMLMGREQGKDDSYDTAATIFYILLVAVAIYVTLDLNQPERGLIRVSQEPIERLLNSMSKYPKHFIDKNALAVTADSAVPMEFRPCLRPALILLPVLMNRCRSHPVISHVVPEKGPIDRIGYGQPSPMKTPACVHAANL